MTQRQNNKSVLITAAVLLVLAAIAAVSATYAWLGVSRVPFISDVDVSVMVESSLLLAPDEGGKPGEWDTVLDASALLSDFDGLFPVTYTPNASGAAPFSKLKYDETGRADNVVPVEATDVNVKKTTDEKNSPAARAAAGEPTGQLIAIDFWMKCEGASAKVRLCEARERTDGQMGAGTYVVGAPVWNDRTVSHDNGGHGSECTIRLGFDYVETDAEGTEVKKDAQRGFLMYEPNANIHGKQAYENGPGKVVVESQYEETKNVNGDPLIDRSRLIIQNASQWNEQTPVLQGAVVYKAGSFVQNPALFRLDGTNMMKIRLYIWMEGMDADCIAANVADEVSVVANLQFGPEDSTTMETGIVRR